MASKKGKAEINLPMTAWVVDGKTILEPAIQGQTVHIDENKWQVELDSELAPLTDLKLQVNFCVEAHCFEPIYGKILNGPEMNLPNTYEMKITAISQEDLDIIDKWVGDKRALKAF